MELSNCKSTFNILGLFISLIFWGDCLAQEKLIGAKNTPLLNHLYQSKSNNINVGTSFEKHHFIPVDEKNFSQYTQTLVKDGKDLYVFLTGTGRVYKSVDADADSLYFKRLDTTHFYGYNGGAAYFIYKDTIYNFGGNGFWTTNGHMRFYSKFNREWNLKSLDKEIPVIPSIFYVEQKRGYFFCTGDDKNYALKKSSSAFPVLKIDLNKQKKSLLGYLNPKIAACFSEKSYISVPIVIDAPAFDGVIVIFNPESQFLFNFVQNKAFRLINPGVIDYLHGNSRGQIPNYYFTEDSTLSFTFAKDTSFQLHQIKISVNDFEKKGIPLYVMPVNWQLWGVIGLLGISLFIILITYFIRRKKSASKTIFSTNQTSGFLFNEEEAQQSNQFTDGELSVIGFIHDASLSRKYASVEEVNALLGISRKTIEVQKKIRTEAISRINHKYRILTDDDQLLVERIRSEEDRRYQKYMIRTENMQQLKSIIK